LHGANKAYEKGDEVEVQFSVSRDMFLTAELVEAQ